ncbi:hypothetical protein M2459_002496 [Parabacteroides sp. PF5-5]|uniref:plasmid mobilization protein n=1 Tax=unclassified Parabacteroides TaxID=2649774 RepID=UPI0024733890|nr:MULTISPECIES: hypothetical protein [unclassified Parabacteroides]MDH6305748.1 hypothetical protein [Parabacteroides sp. PH5-39]MDH6316820.1 hypothetical protein [Parabacteroides sp. PF5-13]MDH6320461.1 hypothetical protein [Parabacteroides sp. PH5-13]MDH6324191.1 hypothetical protein [Parabacteroides sp. PH5-8]MDH6328006.1 hypothetical protein [Parabacteroides sp. PH5-41]
MAKKTNKDKWIHVRLTENEYRKLQNQSKPFSSMSAYIRVLLFSKDKVIVDPKSILLAVKELSNEINRVGGNINQIAKFMNFAEKNGLLTNEIVENLILQIVELVKQHEALCMKINYIGIK